jgi:hypothetical protein
MAHKIDSDRVLRKAMFWPFTTEQPWETQKKKKKAAKRLICCSQTARSPGPIDNHDRSGEENHSHVRLEAHTGNITYDFLS